MWMVRGWTVINIGIIVTGLSELVRILSFFERQLVLYGIVGVFNTLFGYGCYAGFYYLGAEPWLALLMAACLAVVFNYFTIGRVVFKNKNSNRFVSFLVAFVVTYLLNKWLLEYFIDAGFHPLLVQAVLAPAIAAFSFIVLKIFVFKIDQTKTNWALR